MPEALIWGASSGIGRALVTTLHQQGWTVFAAARNTANNPAEADLNVEFDAASESSVKEAVYHVAQAATQLDLMVYAAGHLAADTLEAFNAQAWHAVMNSNLHGALYTARSTLPLLREGAHVFFIGAYVEHLILPKFGAYAVAKAGLEPLVQIMQKEHRKHKFTIVHPGPVDTGFWANAPIRLPKDAKSPTVVSEAILAHYTNGQNGPLNL
jgi:NAD(P)-dependent dehydrogenase (short-subunit alcohol dehydrogenase family)